MNSRNFKSFVLSTLILNSLGITAFAEEGPFGGDPATAQISDLPPELFLEISKFLDLNEQRILSCSNRNFRNILNYKHFGKKITVIGKTLTEEDFQVFSGPNSFYSTSREVNLSRSTFPAQALAYLSPELESLNLSQCHIIGDPAVFISRFTHLKTLILNDIHIEIPRDNNAWVGFASVSSQIRPQIPTSVLSLLPASLQILDLSGNRRASEYELSFINQAHLPNLKYLGLSDITPWGLNHSFPITSNFFVNLPKTLEHLNLTNSQVESLATLNSENFPNLKFLDLSGMEILEEGIIQNLPLALEWLDLTGSKLTRPEELLLISNFQQLKGLSLNHTHDLSGQILDEVLKLTHLEILDLSTLGGVLTEDHINRFLAMPSLTRLIRFPFGQTVSGLHLFGPNPVHWTNMAKEKDSQGKLERARTMGRFLN